MFVEHGGDVGLGGRRCFVAAGAFVLPHVSSISRRCLLVCIICVWCGPKWVRMHVSVFFCLATHVFSWSAAGAFVQQHLIRYDRICLRCLAGFGYEYAGYVRECACLVALRFVLFGTKLQVLGVGLLVS